ncbi:hypothetical protein B0T11DRAFT_111765 [Plectosphaerella cucumerina]|uniref:HIT-type domain-containing protein n=1 Tax=Plectosphaerella cucumerina TaxID=40658 RepID=A0A8K0TCG5_9PEZI|nr:hypothetical protein B0T11DRAFT_111765 [Plectosphaerella cucumerina]
MASHNFGVIEVASRKTTSAPGWAYVPDTGANLAAAALQPSNRKRARNQASLISGADLTARQETKVRKDLEALDRDTSRDVNIAIPSSRPGPARGTLLYTVPCLPRHPLTEVVRSVTSKSTPNIRKIIQSQKTFANHLDDYNALVATQGDVDASSQASHHVSKPSHPNQHSKRSNPISQNKKKASTASHGSKRSVSAAKALPDTTDTELGTTLRSRRGGRTGHAEEVELLPSEKQDLEMTDAPESDQAAATSSVTGDKPLALVRAEDHDSLLASIVPELPDRGELDALLNHPPLTYLRARATWGPNDQQYPVRTFCDVCGYWGRVRCTKCGTRVCALDCLEVHREDCITRYGL